MDNHILSVCDAHGFSAELLLKGVLEGIDDIIGIYKPDNTLLLYNKAGYEFFNATQESIFGKKCFHMLNREERCSICTTQLALEKNKLVRIEKYIPELKKYMECTANPVFDNSGKLILIIEQLRDITEAKRDLRKASSIQRQRLDARFPLPEKASMEVLYKPAMSISGDFYHLYKLTNDCVIGLLGDVSGKGISAALSISAMKVLFYEAIQYHHEPYEVLNYMNKKIQQHFFDDYVAACCFKFDFKQQNLSVSCAAVNEFSMIKDRILYKHELKGSFLGMFEETEFEQKCYEFSAGDKIKFYSDGIPLLIEQDEVEEETLTLLEVDTINSKIRARLSDALELKDDCTLISFEIK